MTEWKLSEAASETRVRAEQGDAKAQASLGYMYSEGQGLPQDYAEALRWYQKAADQGYAKAQYNLGNMYYYGRGVPRDRAEAEHWYQKAVDQGDEYAQRALGVRGPGFTISLLAMLLGCWVALNGSLSPQRGLRQRQPRTLTVAAVCGLASIGLTLYWDFAVFPSVLAGNALLSAADLAAGITVATLISVIGLKWAKVVLWISAILLIVTDLIVISLILISRHDVMSFVTTSRGVSSLNGLSIGIAVPLAMFVWLETIKRTRDKQAAG